MLKIWNAEMKWGSGMLENHGKCNNKKPRGAGEVGRGDGAVKK